MKISLLIFLSLLYYTVGSCQNTNNNHQPTSTKPDSNNTSILDTNLVQRFDEPYGFSRILCDDSSYANYLRTIKLKPKDALVHYFDGSTKNNTDVYCAVVDQPISKRDLQQCADAVMRLRAEYLFQQKRYEEIHFNFLSDNQPRYFVDYGDKSMSYSNFLKYMNYIFAFANTRSLYNELVPVHIDDIQIGDVFIQTGNPFGHAVTVMDMAKNKNGDVAFILSQSYMPAQETQILNNPNQANQSPWYFVKGNKLITPEWTFEFSDLRRFNPVN